MYKKIIILCVNICLLINMIMFNVKCIDEYKYLPYKHDKVIYLTFDDGPSPNTNKVLDILNRNNVKATFFVIGNQVEMHKEGMGCVFYHIQIATIIEKFMIQLMIILLI